MEFVVETSNAVSANRTVLSITGMTCSGCVSTVTRILSRVPGVTRAEVDLPSARALVEGPVRPEALVTAAEAAGFGAQIIQMNEARGR
jgi:copper chaperone CopZ